MFDCANVEMRELLPELAAGTLDDATRARVERHVASCAECASELETLRLVRSAYAATPTVDVRRIVAALPKPAPPAERAHGGARRQAMDRLASRGGPNDDLGRRPLARGGASSVDGTRRRAIPLLRFHPSTRQPVQPTKTVGSRTLAVWRLTIQRGPSIGPVVHPPPLGRKRSSRLPAARMTWTTYRSRRCLARSTRWTARRWLRPKSRIPRRCCP